MKLAEFRKKNKKEINEELRNLLREQFSLRIQIVSGQLQKTHLIKKLRRDIARIKTFISDKETN